jgi:hypothetical protein
MSEKSYKVVEETDSYRILQEWDYNPVDCFDTWLPKNKLYSKATAYYSNNPYWSEETNCANPYCQVELETECYIVLASSDEELNGGNVMSVCDVDCVETVANIYYAKLINIRSQWYKFVGRNKTNDQIQTLLDSKVGQSHLESIKNLNNKFSSLY